MVKTERDIMTKLNSPFLVNLVHAFQDDKEVRRRIFAAPRTPWIDRVGHHLSVGQPNVC